MSDFLVMSIWKNPLAPATAFTYFPIYIAHIVHLYLIILLKFEKKKELCSSSIDTSFPPPPTLSLPGSEYLLCTCLPKKGLLLMVSFPQEWGEIERDRQRRKGGGVRVRVKATRVVPKGWKDIAGMLHPQDLPYVSKIRAHLVANV